MSNYKIYWVTLCKNEEDIIPFCIQYWKRIANKVIVYDNHSTDSSVELLSQYDWIKIRTFDSEGQNDVIQKEVKEKAYLEFKDQCDILIISDMDEIFYFPDGVQPWDEFISENHNVLMPPIYSLCEDTPPTDSSKLLHEQCHKFYKQRMNHMIGFDQYSKLSIFNTKITDKISMSVGQHYVNTFPNMDIMIPKNGFCLHIDKGFGLQYKYKIRQRMNANLSYVNKRARMCIEYSDSFEKLAEEYKRNQENSFDINVRYNNNKPQ